MNGVTLVQLFQANEPVQMKGRSLNNPQYYKSFRANKTIRHDLQSEAETINSQNCYNIQMTCYEKLVPILTITFVFTPNLKKKVVDKE